MILKKYVIFVWFGALAILSGFLIAEYNFFSNQVVQLEQLKSQYNHSIDQLKKLITSHENQDDTSSDKQIAKKKTKNGETTNFLVVNREPAYLKKSALSFARRYKLEQALNQMYEADSYALQNSYGRKIKHKGIKFRRKRPFSKSSSEKPDAPHALIKREPLFIWPLKRNQFYLSSTFGPRKKPNGTWEFHKGLDLAAPRGTLVCSVGPGVVIQATYAGGFGNTVLIAHSNKLRTRYAHLDKILVKEGQTVHQGEYIGKVGCTGCVRASKKGGSADHLHFEVYVFGKQVNPYYFLK